MTTSRNWIGTINNPTILFESLWDPEAMNYMIGQLEKGEEGTLHYQLFINLKRDQRLSYLKKINNEAHWEIAKDANKARNYCKKEESRVEGPWEFGEFKKRGGDHKSLNYKEADKLWEEDKTQLTDYQIVLHEKARKIVKKDSVKEQPEFPFSFHPWQKQLMARLGVIDDRKIIFIVDKIGGSGKTKFASWYTYNNNSIYITIEKKENLLYLVEDFHTCIFMDVARAELEFLNYSTLEKIKDGHWYAGKYEGKEVHRFVPAQVVVFCNGYPNTDALSRDRYEIYTLDKNFLEYLSWADCKDL